MIDWQKETGFTKYPNKLLAIILIFPLTRLEKDIIHYIVRRTIGWHQKKAQISLEEFQEKIEGKRRGIIKAINKLTEMNIIHKEKRQTETKQQLANIYSINFEYDEWEIK